MPATAIPPARDEAMPLVGQGPPGARAADQSYRPDIDGLRAIAVAPVEIVGPIPEPTYDGPQRSYVSHFGFVGPPADLTEADYRRRHATILAFFHTLEGKAEFIWPERALCRDGRCPVVAGKLPLCFDHNHLSVATAEKIAPVFDVIFNTSLSAEGSAP